MLPLIPIAGVAVVGGISRFLYKKHKEKKALTPARAQIYDAAMQTPTDPQKLATLSKKFKQAGLHEHASMLMKRAKLRMTPKHIQKARRKAFKKAIKSKDPNKVKAMAKVFHSQGATGAASTLNKYAAGLNAKGSAKGTFKLF